MSYNKRGERDGTGPHKDSAQRQVSNMGQRQEAGEECPRSYRKGGFNKTAKRAKKSTNGSPAFTGDELRQGYRKA